jgi:hypothetical protein
MQKDKHYHTIDTLYELNLMCALYISHSELIKNKYNYYYFKGMNSIKECSHKTRFSKNEKLFFRKPVLFNTFRTYKPRVLVKNYICQQDLM